MSTDIISFQTDSEGKSQEVFRSDALRVFIAISLPLMVASFVAWYGVYWWVNRKVERKCRSRLWGKPGGYEGSVGSSLVVH